MVTQIFVANAKSWRQAAAIGSRAKEIYNLLKSETDKSTRFHEIVKNNAQYITSIPQAMAEAVTDLAAKSYGEGKRPKEVMQEILAKCPGISESKAKLIARTETSKASTALTRSRAERLNLNWYVWRNSEDERVRSSHDHMGGVLVNWDDPPSPEALDPRHRQKPYGKYHAGDTFNCRCYPEPLLNTADISWPARVYHNGKIKSMSLAKFKALNGGTL